MPKIISNFYVTVDVVESGAAVVVSSFPHPGTAYIAAPIPNNVPIYDEIERFIHDICKKSSRKQDSGNNFCQTRYDRSDVETSAERHGESFCGINVSTFKLKLQQVSDQKPY